MSVSKEKRILVVAQESAWRSFVEKALTQNGYNIQTQGDVQAALENITDDGYNLIIVDALWVNLLTQLATRQPPHRLLVATTTSSVSEAVMAYRLGALDYITQVFDTESLLETVNTVLGKQPVQPQALI